MRHSWWIIFHFTDFHQKRNLMRTTYDLEAFSLKIRAFFKLWCVCDFYYEFLKCDLFFGIFWMTYSSRSQCSPFATRYRRLKYAMRIQVAAFSHNDRLAGFTLKLNALWAPEIHLWAQYSYSFESWMLNVGTLLLLLCLQIFIVHCRLLGTIFKSISLQTFMRRFCLIKWILKMVAAAKRKHFQQLCFTATKPNMKMRRFIKCHNSLMPFSQEAVLFWSNSVAPTTFASLFWVNWVLQL